MRKTPKTIANTASHTHAINDTDYDTSDQESTIGCLSASVNTVHLEDSVRVHETLTTSDLSEEVGVFEILHTADTDARIEKVRAAMKHDQSMQILIRTIRSGWPNERRRCPKQIQDFWNIRDELAIVDDESSPLVIKGHRIEIPLEQREEILQQLHIGHFGIEKTKQRARDAVYWPRLNTDIESLFVRCSICQEHPWAPLKEPMMNRPIPTRPFQVVAVDMFECDDKHYLSLQDYYSRYIEVERLYSIRASLIIMKIKGIMARHGTPEQLFSDNGPQFSCAEGGEGGRGGVTVIHLYLYRRVCVCLSVCVSFWAYTRRRRWSDRDQIRHTHGDSSRNGNGRNKNYPE